MSWTNNKEALLVPCILLSMVYFRNWAKRNLNRVDLNSDNLTKENEDEQCVIGGDEDNEEEATTGRDRRLIRNINHQTNPSSSSLLAPSFIFTNLICEEEIQTPLGKKRAVYCDWTASGKSLHCIETYMLHNVLPYYANTHSIESKFGLQTSCFREESREIIQLACNANRTKDVVIFVGNGVTGAIHKLISGLSIQPTETVIFVGPFEHTSNLVPWRETGALVINIPEDVILGTLDVSVLEAKLKEYAAFPMKIGSFSACSNVTGRMERVDLVTNILGKHSALSFWDYATLAPYGEMDMNPATSGAFAKDAIMFSGHKFAGGPGSSGVLIAKRKLFNNRVPEHGGGGGTVYFVDESSHRFLSDVQSREEGGTPNILADIRVGLSIKLKQSVSVDAIRAREEWIMAKCIGAWAPLVTNGQLVLAGGDATVGPQLPIFSFLIRKNGRFLHHHFVVALLNDLYGIQARAGCLCAGPYVERLLGMSADDVLFLETWLVSHTHAKEQYRPGWTRLSLPYFLDDYTVDYIIQAVCDLAMLGWRLLCEYRFENTSGEWGHIRGFQKNPNRVWLADFMGATSSSPPPTTISLHAQLAEARARLQHPKFSSANVAVIATEDTDEDWMRWFVLPNEAILELNGEMVPLPHGSRGIILHPELYLKTPLVIPTSTVLRPSMAVVSKRDRKQPKRQSSNVLSTTPPILQEDDKRDDFLRTVQRLAPTSSIGSGVGELFPLVPSKLIKPIVQASKDWGMIRPGDRLLLGLSGGKDSLCLLHALLQIQKRVPFKFDLACVTVDPGAGAAFDPRALIPYLAKLNVPYFYEESDIFDDAKEKQPSSYCSYCARMKRGILYRTCERHGYNKLVLAQHLDDFVESFFMSLTRNGSLRTMKANYEAEDHRGVRVIRPLAYVREKQCKKFSYESRLPVINENCPACFSKPTERQRVKQWLKEQEEVVPLFFESVRKAILPLMDDGVYVEFARVQDSLRLANGTNEATKNAKEFGQGKKTEQQGSARRRMQEEEEEDFGFSPEEQGSCSLQRG